MKTTFALALLLSSLVWGASSASAQWDPNLVCANPGAIPSQFDPHVLAGLPKCDQDCGKVAAECDKRVKDAVACLTRSYGGIEGFGVRIECAPRHGQEKKACMDAAKSDAQANKLLLAQLLKTQLDSCQAFHDLCVNNCIPP
jgi:hypothetical protein